MNTDLPPTRVLIVEDHPVVRLGLRQLLEDRADMQVIADTEYGEEAIRLVEEHAPDVVLLDLILETSQIDGLETLQRISTMSPSTAVVVLSAYSDDELILSALFNGAIGYMLKRSLPDEVLEAIRDAARGQYHLDPLITKKMIERLRSTAQSDEPLEEIGAEVLTDREREILRLIVQGKTNKQIAEILTIAYGTAKTHVSNILRKLDIPDRRQAWQGLVKPKRKPSGNNPPGK